MANDKIFREVFDSAKSLHELIVEALRGVQIENNAGELTPQYLALTTALMGCKTVILQMEKQCRLLK
jgi:hypothetical protein